MLLTVHAHPNARTTRVTSWLDDETVKIDVAAVPEDGKANKALVDFLAKELNVPASTVHIVRGLGTRMKHISIDGMEPEDIKKGLK